VECENIRDVMQHVRKCGKKNVFRNHCFCRKRVLWKTNKRRF